MKTLVFLCVLGAVGFGVVHGNEVLCFQDIGDTINEGCVNCTCIESPRDARDKVWSCVQTCSECPSDVIPRTCLVNYCIPGVTCRLHQGMPDLRCIIPLCDSCETAFVQNGNLVNCTHKQGMCPEPMGTGDCTNRCSEDMDCPNNKKCCSNGCGTACSEPVFDDGKPGMCPMPVPGSAGLCVESCSGDGDCPGLQKCCSNGCGSSCQDPEKQVCPRDQPLMNCSYDEVCSSSCPALPSARCLVDHCGGCSPVYITAVGSRINCTTGEVMQCPPGQDMVNCLIDPCSMAECPADPMARCISVYCGDCKAVFVNAQGEHINCTTGAGSICPPGQIENPADKTQACSRATCPALPSAQCAAKQCVWPNSLDCLYEFFDARAQPVQCSKVKRGQCPHVNSTGEVGGICVNECLDDTWCEGDEICCPNECGGAVCLDPEDDDDMDMDMDMDTHEPVWKPGTCPMSPMGNSSGICVQECDPNYGDAGCPRHWKCCSNGCGHACRAPKEMPDECPMVPEGANMTDCQMNCTSDRECQSIHHGAKCCSTGCGATCMKPVTSQKPGSCPMPPMDAAGTCLEECLSDDDCEFRAKCCSNGCGQVCMNPQEQPGDCPVSPDLMMLRASPQVICSSDSHCGGLRSKCCAYGCRQICVEPVTDVLVCPMPLPGSSGVCVEACSGDEDCPRFQMCCSNGCGHTCQVPVPAVKPGMCPMPVPDSAGICVEDCRRDGDCLGTQKCCSNGCGHTCQDAAPVERVGVCPMVPPGLASNCNQKSCSMDENCPGRKKCCDVGCEERICLVPLPGVQCNGELPEICEFDPCQFATCPSAPNATCAADKCGRCRPKFFDMDLEEVSCTGKQTCRGLETDTGRYESGSIVDSSDGCNQCVCNGRGIWICSKRRCDKVIQVSLTFDAPFDRIMERKDNFIGKLKKVLAMKLNLPANAMRDFKLSRGSVIVDFKVSSDATVTVDIEEAVANLENEVTMGTFRFEFDGEEVQAERGSFQSDPYVAGGVAPAGPVFSAISVLASVMIAIVASL